MLANFEKREYAGHERVWIGRYRNLHNLPHWHLESELIYIEKGSASISHNREVYSVCEGSAIFLGSGEIHYIRSDQDSIVDVFLFDSALIYDMTHHYQLASAKLNGSYPIVYGFNQISEELHTKNLFYEQKICEIIIGLMIQIFRNETLLSKEIIKENTTIANYKNLLNEIDNKYSYITFTDAAAFMGLSEPYFSKFFRKTSGMTFSQYLNTVRLEKAIGIIQTNDRNLSITEISSLCGFDTIRHFNRTFKEITGMSPRQLPPGYVLDIQPIRTIQEAFNPTLQSSELLS